MTDSAIAASPPHSARTPLLTLVDRGERVADRGALGAAGEARSRSFAPQASLTARECRVLSLMADGLSTREVATTMAYSERTIKNILQELTGRLNLRNRTQAVAYAVRRGWI